MIKVVKTSVVGVHLLVSDAGSKAACEADINDFCKKNINKTLPMMYSKGVPFVMLPVNNVHAILDSGVDIIDESEAEKIRSAFK